MFLETGEMEKCMTKRKLCRLTDCKFNQFFKIFDFFAKKIKILYLFLRYCTATEKVIIFQM